jgi:hypothetical protein
LPERKETVQGIHHEAKGDFKTFTKINGCDRKKQDGSTTLYLLHNTNLNDSEKKEARTSYKYSKTCILFAIRH